MNDQAERLRRIFARITYKKGWEFHVNDPSLDAPYQPIHYFAVFPVMSIDNPDVWIKLSFNQYVHPDSLAGMSAEQIVDYIIGGLIRNAELHEMDEWLKLDGECVRDPHPERKVPNEYSNV